MVAGDDHQDPAGSGSRDALSCPDSLSRGFGRRQSPLPGWRVSGSVRRRAHLLLQLRDAALSARAPACCGHGAVHCRWRLPACAVGRNPHGRGHVVHGARWAQPRERGDGPGRGRRGAWRCARAHGGQRGSALHGRERRGVYRSAATARRRATEERRGHGAHRNPAQTVGVRALRHHARRSSPPLRHSCRARVHLGR